jgi:fatty-acyl-CoA synthase
MGLISTIKREVTFMSGLRRTLKWIGDIDVTSANLLPDDLEKSVDAHPDHVAIQFEDQIWTYRALDAYANRVANWALNEGLKPGDCAALFMENRPEYIATWLGLTKAGVVVALINSNLNSHALAHCINIAKARIVIAGGELAENVASAEAHFTDAPALWSQGKRFKGAKDLDVALEKVSTGRPDRAVRDGIKAGAVALYVYTSGTTGLPKAARLTHSRTQGMMRAFIAPCGVTARDRVYITLPLYHGTGGLCGVGCALYTGASIILRKKFSASQFWEEAIATRATVFVYIGELWRYLLNQPKSDLERQHTIRTAFGNGLRAEIWEKVIDRFGIEAIREFYGSTEGNVSFVNYDNKVGAVGRIPAYLEKKFNVKIVRFDVETEEPVRGPDGFCIEAAPDEAGEAIGQIGTETRSRFEGYNDPAQTAKKVLRDVFETGDMWFRTGDLMKRDKLGYYYFVDRIGDTFRWKSENVSTNEVADAISQYAGVEHVNVYGVPVPGNDGKAGMAAIVAGKDFDIAGLKAHLEKELPSYARPLFVRLQPEPDTTGTFKYRKLDLVAQGFDPAKTGDPVYFDHPAEGGYVPVKAPLLAEIEAGALRF